MQPLSLHGTWTGWPASFSSCWYCHYWCSCWSQIQFSLCRWKDGGPSRVQVRTSNILDYSPAVRSLKGVSINNHPTPTKFQYRLIPHPKRQTKPPKVDIIVLLATESWQSGAPFQNLSELDCFLARPVILSDAAFVEICHAQYSWLLFSFSRRSPLPSVQRTPVTEDFLEPAVWASNVKCDCPCSFSLTTDLEY